MSPERAAHEVACSASVRTSAETPASTASPRSMVEPRAGSGAEFFFAAGATRFETNRAEDDELPRAAPGGTVAAIQKTIAPGRTRFSKISALTSNIGRGVNLYCRG